MRNYNLPAIQRYVHVKGEAAIPALQQKWHHPTNGMKRCIQDTVCTALFR